MTTHNVWSALIAAKADFGPVLKTARGQFGRYPNLETVLDAIDPALHDNGLWPEMFPYETEDGDYIGLIIRHPESDTMAGPYYEPVMLEAPTAQKRASGVTYARRYLLMTVFGLAAEDDDGQAASTPQVARRNGSKSNPAPEPDIDMNTIEEVGFSVLGPPWGENPRALLELAPEDISATMFSGKAQALAWAEEFDVFNHHKHASSSYDKLKNELNPTSAREMWVAWIAHIGNKINKEN